MCSSDSEPEVGAMPVLHLKVPELKYPQIPNDLNVSPANH